MATHTDYFNLEKPESYENYNIEVFNDNADTIDLQMHNNQVSAAKVMVGATSLADGESGRVPTPHAGDEDKFLKGDGTWGAVTANVEANPSGTPTDTLETIGINNVIYQLPEGGDTEITGDVEGSVIAIDDGKLNAPLKACTVDINPVQDLHGYDHPWAAGAGKNKCYIEDFTTTLNGLTISSSNNLLSINGTCNVYISASHPIWENIKFKVVSEDNYMLSFTTPKPNNVDTVFYDSSKNPKSIGSTLTAGDYTVGIYIASGTVLNNYKTNIQVEQGTTATTFAPYSNICPISGWTEANITVADATVSPTVSNTYNIEFEDSGSPLTVYGGTLDTVSGVLTVTDGYIASYNGETLPSTWISDRDVYASGTTPTTGAEVVYKLATPTEISLTPAQITTLYGNNVIWADCGDIAITYVRDTSIAINDALNQSITPTYSSGTKIADYNVGGQTGAIYVQGAGGTMDTLWTGNINPTSDSMPTVQLANPLSGYDYIVVEGYGAYDYYTTDAIYKPVIGRTYLGKLNDEINYCAVLTIINDSNVQLKYWGIAGSNTNIVAIYGVKI